MSNKVMYRAHPDDKGYELVKFGAADGLGRRCTVLIRFGSPITHFMASKGQVAKLRRGGRVNVTVDMITAAQGRALCATLPGAERWRPLRGPRRHRRRR